MAKKTTRLRFTEDDLANSHVKKAASNGRTRSENCRPPTDRDRARR